MVWMAQAVCQVAHLGLVLSGRKRIEMTDGRVIDALMPETVRRRQRDAVVTAAFVARP